MKKQVKQLKEFHKVYNLPIRSIPTIIPQKEFNLRHRILREEVFELLIAQKNKDIVEVADAIIDCMYILIGTAVQFGIADKLEDCFNEIHRSNMSKLNEQGKPIMRADGKVLKGNLYSPPNLSPILKDML
jgi:predicted HAD superfamily Cof-like phosphohydrolase